MGSKKRIFYNAPQKKIKQRRKNRYASVDTLPKFTRYRKSLEFQQKSFLFKKFKGRRYYPSKAVFIFFSRILKQVKPITRLCGSLRGNRIFVKRLVRRTKDINLSIAYRLTRRGGIRLYKEERLVSFLNFCFFKLKALYKLSVEAQTLFQLGNSTQQYHLNTVGINYPFFATMSSGRCLRKNFGPDVSKSLKKSFKLNKLLVDYYFNASTFDSFFVRYTHTFIKPFNKKALVLFNQLQENSAYYHTVLGFRKYFKTNYKTYRRIKKRIKKRITSENLKYSPFKSPVT